jgi:pyrimidine-specific ribonucleoside hydrolase
MPGPTRQPWISRLRAATVASLVLVLAACGGSASPGPTGEPGSPSPTPTGASGPIPLIVDNDMSFDDVMAIAFLLNRPEVDLIGVTVTGTGIAHCGPGARNARDLLHELGGPEVPTACGSEEPIGDGLPFPDPWRDGADDMFGLGIDGLPGTPKTTAVELLTELIRGSDRPVTILATGPFTNLAEALAADPSLAEGIERLVIMGGAVDVDGNATEDAGAAPAEWNFAADPLAVEAVWTAGIPMVLVPLDATNDVPIEQAFVDELQRDSAAGPANLVEELLLRNSMSIGVDYFWDVLAAMWLVEPGVVTTEEAAVSIVPDGAEAGRSIRSDDGTMVTLATAADREAFESAFLETLRSGGPRRTPFVLTGELTLRSDGTDCEGGVPAAPVAGTYLLGFSNESSVDMAAVVIGLTEGSTWDDLDTWIADHPGTIDQPPMVIVHGVAFPAPGTSGSALVELPSGDTALVCLVAADDQQEVISGDRFVVE